jgi:hypothetical protein
MLLEIGGELNILPRLQVADRGRYVTKDDIRTFGTIADRQKALSVDGWLGQEWLAK